MHLAVKSWRWWAAIIGMLGLAAWATFDWHRFHDDMWPPDRSFVGPNLTAALVQGVLVLVAVAVFYPPLRRAFHRFTSAKLDNLHAKLDHIIVNHPEIPNEVPGVAPRRKPQLPQE